MSTPPEAPKGTIEQLRETLGRLVPLLRLDIEPAFVVKLESPEDKSS